MKSYHEWTQLCSVSQVQCWISVVEKATSQLVTRSTRHTHVSSHSQLVTSEHITKPPVPVVIICTSSGETVLNTDGVITAICVTLMYTADYRSRRQITLLRKARSTGQNAVKHDGQLVTRFYGVMSWPCDDLTGSLRYSIFSDGQTSSLS